MNKPKSSEAKKTEPPIMGAEWSAFAPGKEAWKRNGNYFTSDELRKMDGAEDLSVYQPVERILIAD